MALVDGGRAEDAQQLLARAGAPGTGGDGLSLLAIRVAAAAGDVHGALAELEAVIRTRPELRNAHLLKAQLLMQHVGTDEGIAAWTTMTRLWPEDVEALSGLGQALVLVGRHEDAVEVLTRVAQLNPTSPDPYLTLVGALRDAAQLDDAEWAARTALELDPTSGPAHLELGLVLEAAGRLDEATVALREAVRLRAGAVPPLLALARVAERNGRGEEALDTLERAAALPAITAREKEEVAAALRAQRRRAPNERAFAGRLDAFSVWQILELLRNLRSTGRLELATPTKWVEICVRDGHLVRIASDDVPSLAQLAPGIAGIDRERCAAALRGFERESDVRVAQQLLHYGVLDEARLRAVMAARLAAALEEIVDSNEGSFSFQQKAIEVRITDVEVDSRLALLEIVKARDDAAGGEVGFADEVEE
jgi:Flp pilus assembly protein TadD